MQSKRFLVVSVLFVLILAAASPAFAAGNGPVAPLIGQDAAGAIPGRYIVVLKADTESGAAEAAIEAATRAGGNLHFRYSEVLNGFAITLPDRAVEALRNNPHVDYIEADSVVSIDTTQTGATWGIDRIDQRALPLSTSYTYNYTGAGVTAYIIDTGILITHSEFGTRATYGYDAVDGSLPAADCNGHGTHVAGTVGGNTYGVAKGVNLVAVRVLDCAGSGTTTGVIAGIDWVTSNHTTGAAVANMSLGGSASTALDTAVKNSIADGVVYAVAAGNNNRKACNYSPARVPEAITVGATTNTDARASYSNYGTCLDIFAPGSSITSSWYTSTTATNTISGTSMATPHVAGAAALYKQANPSATPQQVRDALVNNATSNVVINPGVGSPNKLLYTLFF